MEKKKIVSEDLGEVTKQKKKGPVTVLVIMVILVGFVVLLPNITDFIKNVNLRNIKIPSILDNKEKEEENNTEEENTENETIYYDFLDTTSIVYDKVTYSNFEIAVEDDSYLQFMVKNEKADTYNLSTKNLYFELYDNEQTLLERVKLASFDSLIKDNEYTLKFLIVDNLSVAKIRLIEYETTDYPAVSLKTNEENNNVLTCTNLDSEFIYEFNEDGLIKITETYNYTNEDLEKYAEVLTVYKAKQEALDAIGGISSTLVESGVNFSYNTVADLTSADISSLKDFNYFVKGTDAKVISFEMEAMRYTCE